MKPAIAAPYFLILLAAGLLAAGCGGSAESVETDLMLGYTSWDESVAVSNLTKVLLEEELDYGNVTLKRADAPEIFQGVADGGLDAFQGVWIPRHESYLAELDGNVELLGPWLAGATRASLAAPAYMDVESIEQLGSSGARRILGVKPGASPAVGESLYGALSRYPLEQDIHPDATSMLREVDALYKEQRPFFFVAWAPHWMNLEYEFDYLVDPEGVLGDMPEPSRFHPVTRTGLEEQNPLAYALIDTLKLTDYQLSSLELEIHNAASPARGVRAWVRKNEGLVGGWIRAVEDRTA